MIHLEATLRGDTLRYAARRRQYVQAQFKIAHKRIDNESLGGGGNSRSIESRPILTGSSRAVARYQPKEDVGFGCYMRRNQDKSELRYDSEDIMFDPKIAAVKVVEFIETWKR